MGLEVTEGGQIFPACEKEVCQSCVLGQPLGVISIWNFLCKLLRLE